MQSAGEKEDFARLLAETHQEALEALEGVDHSAALDGGWTVGEVLRYVIALEHEGLAALQAHSAGDEYHPDYSLGETLTPEPLKDESAQRLYAEWEALRELLRAALDTMPPERLSLWVRAPWGGYTSVAGLVDTLIAEQREYLDVIIRALRKAG
ncbi:MAG: hypothetical protein HXY40_13840 [Chloroflexi bacterium]|nr:hypothetical protein [Chloroflexota bacterium]